MRMRLLLMRVSSFTTLFVVFYLPPKTYAGEVTPYLTSRKAPTLQLPASPTILDDRDDRQCSDPSAFGLIHQIESEYDSVAQISRTLTHEPVYTAFIKSLLKDYGVKAGANCADRIIRLRLRPEQSIIYSDLQEEIAKRIPAENRRPTIDLTISSSSNDHIEKTIGISGGTGPLSDAELLVKIMGSIASDESIDWKNFAINLYSAPPPRLIWQMQFRMKLQPLHAEETFREF